MKSHHFNLMLTVLPYFLTPSSARGPHHPRGASIVKRHTHYTPGKTVDKLDTELIHDKEHLKEHLEEIAPKVDLSKMSDAELDLYYFLLHDTDKNSRLDGLELLNAVLHTTHPDQDEEEDEENEEESWENGVSSQPGTSQENFNNFVDLVDAVLKEDDKNQDGYLEYAEYVEGRKKADQLILDKKPSVKLT